MENAIWQQANQALEAGDFAAAVVQYERICEQQPHEAQGWYRLGLAHLLLNGPEVAQAAWMNVIDPMNFEAIAQQVANLLSILLPEGDRQLQNRRFGLAERIFRQTVELDESANGAYRGWGLALAQQGFYDTAIDIWTQSIALAPNDQEAYRLRAKTYEHIHEWPQAIAAYQALLTQFPENGNAYHNWGRCLLKQNALEPAIQALQEAHQRLPQKSSLWGDLGWAYFLRGDALPAGASWQAMVALQPQYWQDFAGASRVICDSRGGSRHSWQWPD